MDLVPWLATTATCRPPITAGIMSLWSNSCRDKLHGVGTGGERGTERKGERKETADGTGNGHKTEKGEADGGEEASGNIRENSTVGGERNRVLRGLQGRKCRLDLALTISGTGATDDWSRNSGDWPRPTWTWNIPGDKVHRRNLHPLVGWVQRRCYGRAKLTPRRSGRLLLTIPTFCGGGRTPVWDERCQLSVSDGSAAVVHHWMLPRPR